MRWIEIAVNYQLNSSYGYILKYTVKIIKQLDIAGH